MTDLSLDDAGPAAATAIAIIHRFGDRALFLVEEQAQNNTGEPAVQKRWHEVADAIGCLTEAHLHMEIALALLDIVGETRVPPHLDFAISALGMRTLAEPPCEKRRTFRTASETEPSQEASQQFDMASADVERSTEAIQCDLSLHRAALRELSRKNRLQEYINYDDAPR